MGAVRNPVDRDTARTHAADLRQAGQTLADIADILGVSASTVLRWTDARVAEKSRAASAQWRQRNRGTCQECGGPTDSSAGKGRAATVCANCLHWTEPEAIAAFRAHFERTGRPPRTEDATGSARRLPTIGSAIRLFGSWNEGLRRAGLPLNMDRFRSTSEEMAEAIASGLTHDEVGARFGCSGANVRLRLRRIGLRVSDLRPRIHRGGGSGGFAAKPTDDPFGLRAARVAAGLSQSQIARAAHTDQSVVSRAEHGHATERMVARLLSAARAERNGGPADAGAAGEQVRP